MNYSRDKLATIAAFGRIGKAKIAKENNARFTTGFCSVAAECGEVEILKWAIENDIPLGSDVWWRLKEAKVKPKVISNLKSEWKKKNKKKR